MVTLMVNDGEFDVSATTLINVGQGIGGDTSRLDSQSPLLNFVSIKKVHVVETHRFESLSGAITDTGVATLVIDLNSVNTGIDIRNERMRNLLFETATFPQATASVDI